MTQPVGRGLPAPLAERLAGGGWLRTAHRGAPEFAPGNSRRALDAAAALGVDMVEVDVHATVDGELILWHDDAIPAPEGRRVIAETPLSVLRRLDLGGGERPITLAEGMEAVRGRAALLIDLKADGLAPAITETVLRLDFAPAVVCGDQWESLRAVTARNPAIGTSLTLGRGWARRWGEDVIESIDTGALTIDWRALDARLIERAHARGLAVLAWTVDAPERMRRLLDLGVDGLTSNRPALLMTLGHEREPGP